LPQTCIVWGKGKAAGAATLAALLFEHNTKAGSQIVAARRYSGAAKKTTR